MFNQNGEHRVGIARLAAPVFKVKFWTYFGFSNCHCHFGVTSTPQIKTYKIKERLGKETDFTIDCIGLSPSTLNRHEDFATAFFGDSVSF